MQVRTDTIDTWILVTGMIRSATTFTGKVLSLPLEVDYIHEPFNGGYTLPGKVDFQPRYFRPDATGSEAEIYYKQLEHIFRYDFRLDINQHPQDTWFKKIAKALIGSRGPFYLRLAKLNPFHRAAVIKDPFAALPALFMYHHFDVRPVIVIRHPTSLFASLKRVGWWRELDELKQDPKLVEDYFQEDATFFERTYPSKFYESMAHWRAIYKVLLTQAKKHPDWIVVTHEDMSSRPLSTFRRLYTELGLPWGNRIRRRIQQMTKTSNPVEARQN